MERRTDTTIQLRCFGCGAIIQNENPRLTGFLPRAVIEGETPLCQRCYRLQHYGEDVPNENFSTEYRKVMQEAKKNNCLLVYVVDLFAFESSLVQPLFEYLKDAPLIVIGNKRDVMPKAVDDKKLIKFINDKLSEYGIKPIETIISSAYKNVHIDEIISAINKYRNGKSVYFVGASSVGKSSLINAFLKAYKNETKTFISTSPYPGTTLDVIKVPLDNKALFYDTPGILNDTAIFAHIDRNAMKYVYPRREIQPRTFQVNDKQSILIGGIARFDYVEGKKTGFTFFVSNECDLLRTKLEKADTTFSSLIEKKDILPVTSSIKSVNDLEKHEFVLPATPVDIMISGLCWVKCNAANGKVNVYAPKGVVVTMRNCKI